MDPTTYNFFGFSPGVITNNPGIANYPQQISVLPPSLFSNTLGSNDINPCLRNMQFSILTSSITTPQIPFGKPPSELEQGPKTLISGLMPQTIPVSNQTTQLDQTGFLKELERLRSVSLIPHHQELLKKNNFPQFFIEAGLLDSFRITKMIYGIDELDSLWNDLIDFKVPTFIITDGEEDLESLEQALESDPRRKIYFYLTPDYDTKSLFFDPKTLKSDLLSNKHNPISLVQRIIKSNAEKREEILSAPEADILPISNQFSSSGERVVLRELERSRGVSITKMKGILAKNKDIPQFALEVGELNEFYKARRANNIPELDSLWDDFTEFKVPFFVEKKGKVIREGMSEVLRKYKTDPSHKVFFYLASNYNVKALDLDVKLITQGVVSVAPILLTLNKIKKIFAYFSIENKSKNSSLVESSLGITSPTKDSDDIEVASTSKKSKKRSDGIKVTSTSKKPKKKKIDKIREEILSTPEVNILDSISNQFSSSGELVELRALERNRTRIIPKLKEILAKNRNVPQFTLEAGELIEFNKARRANNLNELELLWDDLSTFKVPHFLNNEGKETFEKLLDVIQTYKAVPQHKVSFYIASNFNIKALDLDIKAITRSVNSIKSVSLTLNKIKKIFEVFSLENRSKNYSSNASSLGVTSSTGNSENYSISSSNKRKREETEKLNEEDEFQAPLTEVDTDSFWDMTNSASTWDVTDEELGMVSFFK